MRQYIPACAVCLLLAGLAVAGCGGGDEGSTVGDGGEAAAKAGAGGKEGEAPGTGESLGTDETPDAASKVQPTSESKAEFVAKANALCTKRRKEIQAAANKAFSSSQEAGSGDQGAVLYRLAGDAIAPGLEGEAEELQSLGAPAGDEAQVEAIIAAIEAVVAKAREDPKAFFADATAFKAVSKLVGEYGIGACGVLS